MCRYVSEIENENEHTVSLTSCITKIKMDHAELRDFFFQKKTYIQIVAPTTTESRSSIPPAAKLLAAKVRLYYYVVELIYSSWLLLVSIL